MNKYYYISVGVNNLILADRTMVITLLNAWKAGLKFRADVSNTEGIPLHYLWFIVYKDANSGIVLCQSNNAPVLTEL